jgi:hypothetical protein
VYIVKDADRQWRLMTDYELFAEWVENPEPGSLLATAKRIEHLH